MSASDSAAHGWPEPNTGTGSVERMSLRLAMFSPVPPMPSGIAAYLADLMPLLPEAWSVDVFTDESSGGAADDTAGSVGGTGNAAGDARGGKRPAGSLRRGDGTPVRCFPHTAFADLQARDPYDLNVYQVGNTTERAYMLEYVTAHPGLLVLHDGVLHPARLGAAVAAQDMTGYRRMATRCREDVGDAIGHLVAGGLGGPALFRTFPMCEDLVRASRATAMHGESACAWLRAQVPAPVVSVAHWRSVDVDPEARDVWRGRLVGEDEVLIGSFGNIGPERRLDKLLAALAELPSGLRWRLVVAGRVAPDLDLQARAGELGIAERVTWQATLNDADFVAVMAATDVAVNLRYPPARASSGVLHQLLQLGVPTVISDVVHWRDYPSTIVKRVPPGPDEAEHEALRSALVAWVGSAGDRATASAAAASWASLNLTPERMRDSYVEAVGEAVRRAV